MKSIRVSVCYHFGCENNRINPESFRSVVKRQQWQSCGEGLVPHRVRGIGWNEQYIQLISYRSNRMYHMNAGQHVAVSQRKQVYPCENVLML